MHRVQVFDVNETLLDLAAMDPHFQRIFGDASLRVTWFNQMIQSALVATVTGAYHPFGAHAMAALAMTAERAGVNLADDDKEAVAAQLRQLPAHPEVAGALRRLGDAGLRLAALTNSTEQVARAQLEHAGLIDTLRAGPVGRHGGAAHAGAGAVPDGGRAARGGDRGGAAGRGPRLGRGRGRPGRAAPPPSSPAPARSSTPWSTVPRSSAPTWPKSPRPSSPSTATATGGPNRQRPEGRGRPSRTRLRLRRSRAMDRRTATPRSGASSA